MPEKPMGSGPTMASERRSMAMNRRDVRSIRIPDKLWRMLGRLSREENRSAANLIRTIVEEWVRKRTKTL